MPSTFIMPEDEWMALCKKQCVARLKQWGDDGMCEKDGLCGDCVADASERVPKKYHVSEETLKASVVEPLPGCNAFDW